MAIIFDFYCRASHTYVYLSAENLTPDEPCGCNVNYGSLAGQPTFTQGGKSLVSAHAASAPLECTCSHTLHQFERV